MNSSTNIQPAPTSRDLMPTEAVPLSPTDEASLRRAIDELKRSSLAMRLTSLIGRQIGLIGLVVPAPVAEVVNKAAETAIHTAMGLALRSLSSARVRDRRRLHKSLRQWPAQPAGLLVSPGCRSSFRSQPRSCCARSRTSPEAKARI
ncbi:protein of unknown function [Methylocella tundrae]|uniref:Uncharacterized protein n=1 Tax=Methylocella tundrae TaxID=227605 RepID=A0A4U8YWJ3_METTU|nr:protein of unknown function [Methylocella tundrae]